MNQQGRVIACDKDAVWLDVSRQSVCQSCEAKQGCGKQLLDKAGVGSSHVLKLPSTQPYAVGEQVELVLPDRDIAQASLLLYILPLVFMLIFGGVIHATQASEPWVILGSFVGLGVGMLAMRGVDLWQGKRLANHLLIQR